MKTREQLNLENYQQAVKFAGNFAEPFKQEYLAEAESRYQFDQNTTEPWQNKRKFSPLVASLVMLLIILLSSLFYWQSGRYALVQKGEQMHQAFQVKLEMEDKTQKNDRYIESLQNRLRENPNDGDLWYELGQAYALNNEFNSALISYQNAQVVLGEKAAILGAMATADYYDKGQKLSEQAKAWLTKALALDSKESSSLLLLASDAFLHNDYEQAIGYWRRVLDGDNDAINRRAIIQSIEMAKQMRQK